MIAAVLFDLEGVLVDAGGLRALAWTQAALSLHPRLDEREVFEVCSRELPPGATPRGEAANLLRRFALESPTALRAEPGLALWQAFSRLQLGAFDALLSDEGAVRDHAFPRNVALAREVREGGRRTGLLSALPADQVRRLVGALGLTNAFDALAAREDVARIRPDPEAHLLVADELGLAPEACLAVEGSPEGVAAALAAGVRAVAFTTPLTQRRFEGFEPHDRCWTAADGDALCAVTRRATSGEDGRSERAAGGAP